MRITTALPRAPFPAVADVDVEALLDRAEFELRARSATLESILLGVMDRRVTDKVATLQVSLRGDGLPRLEVNPNFVADFTPSDVAFMLAHEAGHLLLNHLRAQSAVRDEAFVLATEVIVNGLVQRAMHRTDLPRSRTTGAPSGVDPDRVYDRYCAAVEAPLDQELFVADDVVCAEELRRMFLAERQVAPTEPCSGGGLGGCGVPTGHEGSEAGEAGGELVERALEVAMARALDGDEAATRQLLALGEQFDHAQVFSRLGLSRLRGESARTGRTKFWEVHLRRVLGTALEPGIDVRYDRKVGWWDLGSLVGLGLDVPEGVGMPLLPGPVMLPSRRVAIYLDTSGSVGVDVLESVAETVGRIPGSIATWHSFDHEVHPFEPGDELPGGGGTCFHIIADHVDTLADAPDAVVVLTDGFAPKLRPPDQHRWIWLITPDGDPWPSDLGMTCVVIDTDRDI